MHEWALAEAVISATCQIAEEEGLKRVTEVKIRLGELQQVELDIFEFALSQLKNAKLNSTKFNIEKVKAELRCRVCGHVWSFEDVELGEDVKEAIHFLPEIAHAYVKCPECGSPDFEVLKGRGVWVESIEGVK